MKLKVVSLVLSCLVNGQESSGDGAYEILEESSSGTIFDDPNFTVSGRDHELEREIVEEELISISFAATSGPTRPAQLNNSSRGSTEQSTQTEQTTKAIDQSEMLVIGLAAGLGALLVVAILTITTCCIVHKRRVERSNRNNAKRPVETNPVEQTFERVDFNRQTGNSTRCIKEKNGIPNGDQTISELAPSSMGTMRTFVQTSNQKPVSHIAIDSDFRNTSSDVDSIESSNATSNNHKLATKTISQVIEKGALVTKVNTYGYQELPTREQSSHASYTTSNSSSAPSDHKIIDQKDTNYLPPYETITRSKDSVIDL